MRKIHFLVDDFSEISIENSYTELNMQTYSLSKKIILQMNSHIFFDEFISTPLVYLDSIFGFVGPFSLVTMENFPCILLG